MSKLERIEIDQTARLVLGGPVTLFLGAPVVVPWFGPLPGRTVRGLLAWWCEARFEELSNEPALAAGNRREAAARTKGA
ncbi:MAG: hypothetical protein KDA73_10545 [Rhodobacteraceae bacterium]|nr:hypothetical protein [Paracoccaceae bacterium]